MPSPSVPSSVSTITVAQCQIMVFTSKLKSVGGRGYPWVTPRYPLKGRSWYLPGLSTMLSQTQYVWRIWSALGPTPYATII